MLYVAASITAADGRMSGPPQRGRHSERMRGGAAQASFPHPLEYSMYYTI
jgi:hypothetical protein